MALIADLDDRPRVVVLRALGLGDTLTAIPALRALAAALPGLRLTVAMPASYAPLLELAGLPCDVLPRTGFDHAPPAGGTVPWAVNLHGRGPQSHRWLAGLRPDRLVAFANEEAGVPGPPWDPDEHERTRWCRLVSSGFGVPADPDDLLLRDVRHRPGPAADGYALVHPGAASAARRWPVDRYAEVVAYLASSGLRVVVSGSGPEQPLVDELVARSGATGQVVSAGSTDLVQLAHLVAGARVLVCGDTGVAHLASATGTPSVVLFGPTSPAAWGPPANGPHRALWAGRTGDPHADAPHEGLLALDVGACIAAVRDLVGPTGPARPAPSGWHGGTSGRRSASAAGSTAAPRPAPPSPASR